MILQKLVGNIYSVFVEVLLWLMPIIGIVGGVIAETQFYLFTGNAFVGFLLGLVAGLLLDLICLGPVVIMMNIRSSLKNIENK